MLNDSHPSQPDTFLEWLQKEIKDYTRLAANERGNQYYLFDGRLREAIAVKEKYLSLHGQPKPEPFEEKDWISVKERPEEYRQVLLWFEGLKTIAIGYLINGYWADENKNLLWCEPDYWAAMPTPPSQLHPSPAPPAVQQEDGEVPEEIAKWIEIEVQAFTPGDRASIQTGMELMYYKMQKVLGTMEAEHKELIKAILFIEKEKRSDLQSQLSDALQEKETTDSYNASLIEQLNRQLKAAYRIIGNYSPIKLTNNE
jgi:hypothetical protein